MKRLARVRVFVYSPRGVFQDAPDLERFANFSVKVRFPSPAPIPRQFVFTMIAPPYFITRAIEFGIDFKDHFDARYEPDAGARLIREWHLG